MTDPVTPEFEYQAIEATQSDPANAEQSNISTGGDAIAARERIAFAAYVKDQGNKIPSNFKDASAWFDSLKNAQKEYTQGQQEIASLKKKYEYPLLVGNPDYVAPVATPAAAAQVVPTEAIIPQELRIPKAPEKPAEAVVDPATVTQADWQKWTVEYATQGTLSEETKASIKTQTNLPDFVIDDFMTGQKAKLEVAYTKAAEVIGGRDHLTKLFTWASKNLSQTEQDSMNASLSSPTWEMALMGLNSKYTKMNPDLKANEPVGTPTNKKLSSTAAQQPNIGYRTKREFSSERNSQRFAVDPAYRKAVESRMMLTDFNKLQA